MEEEIITSIGDHLNENVSVYPNPTKGSVKMDYSINWKLMNAFGEQVAEGTSDEVSLSNFPASIYFLKTEKGIIETSEGYVKRS